MVARFLVVLTWVPLTAGLLFCAAGFDLFQCFLDRFRILGLWIMSLTLGAVLTALRGRAAMRSVLSRAACLPRRIKRCLEILQFAIRLPTVRPQFRHGLEVEAVESAYQ